MSENGTKVGYVNAKEVFGEQSILLETPRTVTAVAIEKSSAVKIPKETLLKEFSQEYPNELTTNQEHLLHLE